MATLPKLHRNPVSKYSLDIGKVSMWGWAGPTGILKVVSKFKKKKEVRTDAHIEIMEFEPGTNFK